MFHRSFALLLFKSPVVKITDFFFFVLRFERKCKKWNYENWTRFITTLYRKCRIIRGIVTLAGIRVGQFMSEWLWIISAVGRIKSWYRISFHLSLYYIFSNFALLVTCSILFISASGIDQRFVNAWTCW